MGPTGETQAGKDHSPFNTLHVSDLSVVVNDTVEFESAYTKNVYCNLTSLCFIVVYAIISVCSLLSLSL